MEAKDTVIKPDELGKAIIKHPDLPMGQAIAIEQAEITFKAMQENRHSISTIVDVGNDAFKDGQKAGRKEIVDWVKGNSEEQNSYWHNNLFPKTAMITEKWQAKLKEWRVSK